MLLLQATGGRTSPKEQKFRILHTDLIQRMDSSGRMVNLPNLCYLNDVKSFKIMLLVFLT